MVKFKKRNRTFIILIILILLGVFSCIRPFNFLSKLDALVSETIVYNNSISQHEEELAVVIIGDKSINALDSWPLDREYYGQLLDNYLTDAKSVVFDILFPNELTTEGDIKFAEAIKKNENVALAYIDNFDGQSLMYPIDIFLRTTNSLGYINYEKDDDGFTRDYILFDKTNNILRKSLAFSALEIAGYSFLKTDDGFVMIDKLTKDIISEFVSTESEFFVVPASPENIKVYELSDILDNKYSKSEFDNKIVLVGGSFTGSSDTINLPIAPVIGLHFITSAVNTLLAGVQHKILPIWLQIFLVVGNILIIQFSVKKFNLRKSIFITLVLLSINFATFLYLINQYFITFNVIHLLFFIILSFILFLIVKIVFREDRLRKIESSLDKILNLIIETKDITNFEDYVKSIETKALNENHFSVKEYLINNNHNLIQVNFKDNENYGIKILKKYVIIPLASLDKNDDVEFIVLSYKKKKDLSQLKNIASLLVSAYTFFKYSAVLEKKNELFMNLFQSMISAVDAKDPITSFHSKRVAEFSVKIGKLLDYDNEQLEKLHFAGIAHDIGKIGVPDNVLNKPSFFSKKDRELMCEHPTKGLSIINLIDLDEDIKAGILQHHEQVDGKGYPNGLKGNEINEIAHIIKIADVYDALTSERQYKKVWPLERVCNLLYEGIGAEFDERITLLVLDEICPEGWIPKTRTIKSKKFLPHPVKEKLFSFMEKNIDLYQKQIKQHMYCINMLETDYDDVDGNQFIRATDIDFHFGNSNTFGEIELGEHFSKKEWMHLNNYCVHTEKEEDRMYYYKHNEGLVKGFVYVFSRGYLNICYVNSGKDERRSEFIKKFENYGEPLHIEKDIKVWDAGAVYICLQDSSDMDFAFAMYLHKYSLQE